MASIVGLAVWAAALVPRTAWEMDRIGQVVDVGIPGLVEGTNLVEESRMGLEGSHEAGNLADLRGQNADSVEEDSIAESTVAVETLVDLAEEVVVAESAVAAAVDSAGSVRQVERETGAAAVGSELVVSTKKCRSGERSACKVWSTRWKDRFLFKAGSESCVYQKEGNGTFHTVLRSRWYNL